MDSERNPQLASILWALKNPAEAGTERQITASSTGHALPESTIPGTKTLSQSDGYPTVTDPHRRPARSPVDPSKIISWAPAQKYIIDSIYSNQARASRIKQLISQQQGQERQWWAEREAMLAKHRARADKEKQVTAILQSMGGIASSAKASDIGEQEAELHKCDLKTHKAMTKLATDIDRELRSMGVPFYAIKHDLVTGEDGRDGGERLGKLDKDQLRSLQKRMLQLLEELFRE